MSNEGMMDDCNFCFGRNAKTGRIGFTKNLWIE
jgi:hypothetical protein